MHESQGVLVLGDGCCCNGRFCIGQGSVLSLEEKHVWLLIVYIVIVDALPMIGVFIEVWKCSRTLARSYDRGVAK